MTRLIRGFASVACVSSILVSVGCSSSDGGDPEGADDELEASAVVDARSAWCPEGTAYDSTSRMCTSDKEAVGPFPSKMVAACKANGGGDETCNGPRWDVKFARAIRGNAVCPPGTAMNRSLGYCADEEQAYGPYTKKLVEQCQTSGGGKACESMRWSKGFLAHVARLAGPDGPSRPTPNVPNPDSSTPDPSTPDSSAPNTPSRPVPTPTTPNGTVSGETETTGDAAGRGQPLADVPYFYQYNNDNEPSATCGITSAAMLLGRYGKKVTPDALYNRFGKAKGQSPPGLESIYEAYGLHGASTYRGTEAMIKRHLDAGRPVVVHGDFTRSGHIMIIIGYNSSGWVVNDPSGKWAACTRCGYPNRTASNGKGIVYSYAAMRAAMYGNGTLWFSTADTKPFSL